MLLLTTANGTCMCASFRRILNHPPWTVRLGVALIGLTLGRGPLPASRTGTTCEVQGLIDPQYPNLDFDETYKPGT